MRRDNVSCTVLLFPPKCWSVFEQMELGISRTQNCVKGWHRRFETLIRKYHVGVYTIIEEIKKEQI